MSQNDMSIANAAGSVVRADINSALQALASNNGGAAAPSTTYANQWWFDTVNDQLKIRDEANTSWIIVASLSGTTWIPYRSGTAIGPMATLDDTAIARDLVMSGKRILTAAQTIASATTVDLSAATGNVITVSGTTPVTGWGTVQNGAVFIIIFSGAVPCTHNATSNIMIGGVSRTQVAGDMAVLLSLGSGNWRWLINSKADGSAIVGATAVATQADQEAATSLTVYVTPGRQHYHPSAAKAWGSINTSAALVVSYNVSSVTDNGVGDYTAHFTTSFSSANFCAVGGITATTAQRMFACLGKAAGTIEVCVANPGTGLTETNVTTTDFACFGDQ